MFEGSDYVYYAMYLVGFAIMMILNLRDHDRYHIGKKEAVLVTLVTYVAGVGGGMLMGKLYSAVSLALGGGTHSNIAIFGAVVFTPILLCVFFRLLKRDWRAILDMLTPGIFIVLLCAKFGCNFAGCCAGFVCDFGIYNPRVEATVFPVQAFETVTMIPIVIFGYYFTKKYKKFVKGMAYPVTAGIYCIARFLWEFARYYAPDDKMGDFFLGLTFWQLWCIFVLVCSIVMFLILNSQKFRNHEIAVARAAAAERKAKKEAHRKKKKK